MFKNTLNILAKTLEYLDHAGIIEPSVISCLTFSLVLKIYLQ